MTRIYHITSTRAREVSRAAGVYCLSTRGKTLAVVGFIHCSYAPQVTRVADALYRGTPGLVLLVIDPSRVAAEIRDEHVDGGEEQFPHIYGPLNLDAVMAAVPFEPTPDGTFRFPTDA